MSRIKRQSRLFLDAMMSSRWVDNDTLRFAIRKKIISRHEVLVYKRRIAIQNKHWLFQESIVKKALQEGKAALEEFLRFSEESCKEMIALYYKEMLALYGNCNNYNMAKS